MLMRLTWGNTISYQLYVSTRWTGSGAKVVITKRAILKKWWLGAWGELAYIFAVKGTFIQFLHRLDIFDIDDAEGLFPWKAEVILFNFCTE